ncbi:hypothetical protein C7B76_14450 [filamentous cyanobacterium CCP2]|nr:hypothetical protein C7B76_14450 [filamentous cyanobacterium CCP2]
MLEKASYPKYPELIEHPGQQASHLRNNQDKAGYTKRQKKRVSRTLRKTIALASLAFGCVILFGAIPGQKAALREKASEVTQQLESAPVEGLVAAIQTVGQNRNRLPWMILPEVESSLLSAVQTARESNRFEQPGKVYTATFTPAQRIAAAGEAGNIYLWDRQEEQTQILQGNGQAIGAIHFSPDGSAVFGNSATVSEGVQFWNTGDSQYRSPAHAELISAAFSSDGQKVITGGASGWVQLWNSQGEWIANLYPRQTGSLSAVAFEGGSIVSGGEDGNITLWDTKGNLQGRLWAGAKVTSLNLSQGGQRIISEDLNRQQAFIWDAHTSQWNQFLLGETDTIRTATLSPDNTIVARGTHDGTVQLFPLDAQIQPFSTRSLLGHQGAVNTVAFSPDGKTILTGGDDGTTRLWDVWDGTLLTKYHLQQWSEDALRTTALSADGKYIAVSNAQGEISLRDVEQNPLAQFSVPFGQAYTYLSFLNGGEIIAGQTIDENKRMIHLWNLDGQEITQFVLDAEEELKTVALSQNGQSIASMTSTGRLQLWDGTGQPLGNAVTVNPLTQFLRFSPNGQQLLGGGRDTNGQTCLWQIRNHSLQQTACHALSSQVAAFSPDGQTIAIGSEDGKIYQWNVSTGKVSQTSQSHTAPITAIAFNADGNRMVSGSADGVVRLATAQGEPIGRSFEGHRAAVRSLAFNDSEPNGQTVVSLGQDGEVRVWQASWQGWLETACHRLQHHPIFQAANTPEARGARATCQQYVWSGANPSSEVANVTANSAQPVSAQPVSAESIAQETRVVVRLGERKVYVFQGDTVQAQYPIAIGKAGWETPTGTFRVFEMLQNPAWTHPITRERMDAGAENPLGTRWIGFWSDRYNKIGFHGTPDRASVGQDVSHGCIRMYDEDVQALYEQIQLGTPVIVEP